MHIAAASSDFDISSVFKRQTRYMQRRVKLRALYKMRLGQLQMEYKILVNRTVAIAVTLEAFFLTLALLTLSWIVDCKQQQQQQRIYGGTPVPDGEFVPYQVSIKESGRHSCGGSIIAPDRILTAAHCLEKIELDQLTALAGVLDVNDISGQSSKVISFVMHEGFIHTANNVSNDIAILKIHPAFKFDNQKVNSIELLEDDDVSLLGRNVSLTGWGLAAFDYLPERLQKLTYKVVSNAECGGRQGQLCTYVGYGKGAGSNDSGGPLVLHDANGLKQVGVLSYQLIKNSVLDAHNAHMRVAYYREWIKQNMK